MPTLRRLLFLSLSSLVTASGIRAAEIDIMAAASLANALREIAPLHEAATGDKLRINLGASGNLARQIREGAPADVFISADRVRMEQLEADGFVLADTRVDLLANTLVLVVNNDRPAPVESFADLAQPAVTRVAIGDPATVPAGTYARALLEKHALWDSVGAKSIPLDNVRTVLSAVESGNADAGFVYRTDAAGSDRVRIVAESAPSDGLDIAYPAAALKNARQPEAARRCLAFLEGLEATAVFLRHGFLKPTR